MVIQNFTDVEIVQNLVENVSSLTTFIQAIGGLILIYIIISHHLNYSCFEILKNNKMVMINLHVVQYLY